MIDEQPGLSYIEGEAPNVLLDRVQGWLALARPLTRKRVEIFHRRAVRVRAAVSGTGVPMATAGREEGVALRLRDLDGHREGFAAAACGPSGLPLAWLLERAAASTSAVATPWREDAARLLDAETDASLPTSSELREWLARARRALEDARGPASGSSAWVEAALTVESLVHDGGLAASRSRLRVWAVATHRDRSFPDAPERPHVLAARRLDRLDPGLWAEVFDGAHDRARTPATAADRPVAFAPEAAATLVAALVPIVHGPGGEEAQAVGPGWVVADEPCHPDALVGGEFDDVGFAARRIVLAAEQKVVGRLDGPGCLRRASYRDRPEARPSLIVLAGQEIPLPDDAWRIHAVRIHSGGTGPWIVELDGFEGGTGAIVRGARLIATPDRIVAACSGSFGTPRQAGWGVITPGLILEGLRVEG